MQSATLDRKSTKKQDIEIFPAVENQPDFFWRQGSVTRVT
jgi:hypothetical protein